MGELDWRAVRELMAFASRLRETVERALLPGAEPALERSGAFAPPVDVWESETDVIVEAELPGMRSEEIGLRLEGDSLLLSGELPEGSMESAGSFLRIERLRGRFHRTIPLPVEVAANPTATMHDGVLRVRLPKAASTRRRLGIVKEGP